MKEELTYDNMTIIVWLVGLLFAYLGLGICLGYLLAFFKFNW